VLAKIGEKSQVVVGLFEILLEDGLKATLERWELAKP
jgi:hypothetical protein